MPIKYRVRIKSFQINQEIQSTVLLKVQCQITTASSCIIASITHTQTSSKYTDFL